MWDRMDKFDRFILILGTSLVLGAVALLIALLIALLTVDLAFHTFSEWLTICVILASGGAFVLWMIWKEGLFMRLGIVERIRERRRIAAAASLIERYDGIDLMSTPEAEALPTPIYICGGCGHSYDMTADRMYWVDEQPMLSPGWYCDKCVDKLVGKSRHDRLNMEIFLIMLDSDLGAD